MKIFFKRVLRRLKYTFIFTVLIGAFLLVVMWDSIVYTIPVGSVGVEWYAIGTGERRSRGPLDEGVVLLWPWNKLYIYDTRMQKRDETYSVVSQDGLHFDMDMTFRWEVLREAVVTLNQEVGTDYLNKLIIPEIGSVLRHVIANYPAESLYTTERNNVQDELFIEVTSESIPNGLGPPGSTPAQGVTIVLDDILIANIDLPQEIKDAIERKLSEAELVKEYAFRVQREQLESERKAVEADGIRRFQETVAPAITPSYLQWRGIEATLQLAQSPNSKVVVIGNSESGLPVILDTGDDTVLPLSTPAPVFQPSALAAADTDGDGDPDVVPVAVPVPVRDPVPVPVPVRDPVSTLR